MDKYYEKYFDNNLCFHRKFGQYLVQTNIFFLELFSLCRPNILIFLLVFFVSCQNTEKQQAEVYLQIDKIIQLDTNLYYSSIDKVDTKNIVMRLKGKTIFVLIKNGNSQTYKKIVKKGKGPNEFSFVRFVPNSNNKLLFYDLYKKEIFEINENGEIVNSLKLNLDENSCTFMSRIDNETYISTGLFESGRFAIIDSNGDLLNICGYYPFKDSLKVKSLIFNVCQTKLKVNPGNSKLIVGVTSNSELLEIFKWLWFKITMFFLIFVKI